ncbi:MAG: ABC transporter ATP-binding protein, partial [Acidobacteria bacterium]|nr:ABC transporter ATP-binding protein [Acidobacteriota bacterium]
RRRSKATMWALKDVSLDIMPGEVVGIIGCNGAGKSTLLKTLSRVTDPTAGRIEIYGRVGSLLEVGTGFHPELTGRDNIYLNAAILGMKRAEIVRKFDEIVAFAEIERFIDTPVKRYSSGMYVRLAFSVAAHLEPDVLLIDEVLSVGDMAFQKKCLQKISQMKNQSSAIVIVSHNMIAVKAICERVILLSQGQVDASGLADDVVPLYEKLMLESVKPDEVADEVEEGMGHIRIKAIRLVDEQGNEQRAFETGKGLKVIIEYIATEKVENVIAYAAIRRPDDFICMGTSTKLEDVMLPQLHGPGTIELEIPELLVIPGYYIMDVTFYDQNFEFRTYFLGRKRISFQVDSSLPSLDDKYGVFYQKQNWKVLPAEIEK